MPSHTHIQDPHIHTFESFGGYGAGPTHQGRFRVDGNSPASLWQIIIEHPATATNQNTGGSQAHNNLQPYIVTYMWKRVS